MEKGEQCHMLNFVDDDTEVYCETNSHSMGMSYDHVRRKWKVTRRGLPYKENLKRGRYHDEETAARESEILEIQLLSMMDGDKKDIFNCPTVVTAKANPKEIKNKKKRRKDE
jgi:hypothetical protein